MGLKPIGSNATLNGHFPCNKAASHWCNHIVIKICLHVTGIKLFIYIAKKIHSFFKGNPLTFQDYMGLVRAKYPKADQILAALSQLRNPHSKAYKKAIKHLAEARDAEEELLQDISHLSTPNLIEILKGGYLIIEGDKFFDKWQKAFLKRDIDVATRRSSHMSGGTVLTKSFKVRTLNAQQFAIRGKFVSEALFAKLARKGKPCTVVQLERYPMTLKFTVPHMATYVIHKVRKVNCGPYGNSVHTEHNPIVVNDLN